MYIGRQVNTFIRRREGEIQSCFAADWPTNRNGLAGKLYSIMLISQIKNEQVFPHLLRNV